MGHTEPVAPTKMKFLGRRSRLSKGCSSVDTISTVVGIVGDGTANFRTGTSVKVVKGGAETPDTRAPAIYYEYMNITHNFRLIFVPVPCVSRCLLNVSDLVVLYLHN